MVVRGGSDNVVETAARAIANSPLVKAALHGGDPNWGRIVQAVGGALPTRRRSRWTCSSRTCRCARRAWRSRFDVAALAEAVGGDEVEYDVVLPGDGAETEVFFSDLSHEYVTINADYTT